MSDFLTRLAARAVGEPAAARPRLPALFEEAEAELGDGVADVDEDVIAARPAPVRDAVRAGTASATVAPARGSVPPAPGDTTTTRGTEAAPSSPLLRSSAAPPAARPVRADVWPERVEPAPLEPAPARPTSADAPAAVPAAAPQAPPVVPAVAVVRETLPAAAAAAAPGEGATVRVHIGRLEVRANLQPATSERPRPRPARAEGLSLADYLRGKRELA